MANRESHNKGNKMKTNKAIQTIIILAVPFVFISTGGCDNTKEAIDNLGSRIQCADYCDKKADCASSEDSSESRDDCISDCRQSIEDNCGNEHQEAANDKIDECVDKNCIEFTACMVFEAAPECFGFLTP
jgi:hypothetical protein